MKLIPILVIVTIVILGGSCTNHNSIDSSQCNSRKIACVHGNEESDVKVYYYHGEYRCATSTEIGKLTLKTIERNFDNSEVQFVEINTNDRIHSEIIQKFNLKGVGVLIAKGDNYKNLSNIAFQNAINNPEFLEGKIIEHIESFQ